MSLREVRLRQALFAMVLGGALAVTGCASTGSMSAGEADKQQTQAEEAAPVSGEQKVSVEYVNVVGDGDRVLIGTSGQVKYTVFKLSDPSRLIIDMPGTDLSKVTSPMQVGNDYLGEITAVTYGDDKDIGRIVIALNDNIDHEVKTGDNSILVSLSKLTGAQPAGAIIGASSETVTEVALEAAPEAQAESAAVSSEEPAAAKPASKVLKVSSSKEDGNTVIRIATDGLASKYNSFVLSDPARIVVDVLGVSNSTGKDALKLQGSYVKGVRIGSYADKARLVFDGSVKKLPPHAITVEDGAIVLTLGPNVTPVAKAEPAPARMPEAVPVKAAAVVEAPAPAQAAPVAATAIEGPKVEKVDYRKVGDKGRLTIASSVKPEYKIREGKDGKTVVLDIKGASIPEELTRTLDASKLNTVVASISSYQESLSPRSVRVLVKLKDKATYNVQDLENSLAIDFVQAAAAPAAEAPAAAAEGTESSVINKGIKLQEQEYNGKRIDLDMMDANVSDVLRLLAEISNLNIVASDDVKGTISLRLKNVPWDQAFDIILKSKGLDSIREGNVIRVAPAAKVRAEREAALTSRKAEEKLEDMEIEFVPVNYATADELVPQIKGVLSDRGDVTTDKRTNTLIIKDIRSGIDSARNVVKKLDTTIPQVLIEARIVEASSSFARDLGIQWDVSYGTGGNPTTNLFGASGTEGQFENQAQIPGGNIVRADAPNQYAVNLPATGLAGTLGAIGFQVAKLGANPLVLDLRLSAGESQGQLKTISRPRVTTLDNKEAIIEQGESIPYETTSAAGTSTIFIDAKLSLKVTPHITPDGSVLMKIEATRNSIGPVSSDAGPSINKKESRTEVLVKDGETTVIGGIVITDKNNTDRGIPYLMDIPVLGWLFRSKSVADTQQELLIFITPKIIKDKSVG
ncbi:Type IV pilus biogenesis and competence protein PilQ [uncultured bacterium]|nr:Type IV pilus biogenesis and competence protein PilQ [uncultured bacterium]